MARSLIGGLCQNGHDPNSIFVSEPQGETLQQLQQDFAVQIADADAMQQADLLVLAVKPQVLKSVCAALPVDWKHYQGAVLSIAAGIPTTRLQSWMQNFPSVIRCMPNTPSLLGAGAAGLYATQATNAQQKQLAEQLMQAVGISLWVDQENQIDAVTALSGSGPAYFFYMLEGLQQAAEKVGLPAESAAKLAAQTALGAARMAQESGESAATLRQRVTSPNGTTAAALASLEQDKFTQTLENAVHAAYLRSQELAKELG